MRENKNKKKKGVYTRPPSIGLSALCPSALKAVLPAAKNGLSVLAIDPGITGAFVVTNGKDFMTWPMPVIRNGKETEIDFPGVIGVLREVEDAFNKLPVLLERAVPMAMGVRGAFNYGRGFQVILDALAWCEFSFTMVEPAKWTKEMHQGISVLLKPKARSLIAVRRLFPSLVKLLPTKPKGGLKDGPIDALLIAGYGLRRLNLQTPEFSELDFW
jgi:hypothetical protein